MNSRVACLLSGVCFSAAITFAPLAAFAQGAPAAGGGTMGGGHEHMMGGGQDHMMGGMTGGGSGHEMGGMMGGGMMGGDMDPMAHMMGMMEHMSHMMAMMHDKLAHASDRIASLKTRLKITEAQTPAWNKFADALLAAAKSAEESIETMHMQTLHTVASGLPEKLEFHAKMAGARAASLNAIEAALDPLYASFSDEQKKIADGLHIGSMGLM
jgi:LTXXQ motif family protein